ncbi:MAG TPA: TonB-dependent receptor [Vicinamibacterales bacterium]|nr:TonB-dependent receptor [Vicinamibacterales bacterium]
MKKIILAVILCWIGLAAAPALAQQTAGNITGRITDDQGAAVPGVTVTGRNTETGFTRSDVTDAEGIYRLNSLPVGIYDVDAELSGFTRFETKGIIVNVGQTLDVPITLRIASVQETITVTGESPLIATTQSSVGGVVDVGRIENLPLNGRQFANAALTIPGVGLGYHSDPTKSTQFSPQVAGGNGRNVNYQIDGGDNNDDTVGGLLQLYPLEAIQEFNFVTSRYKAEYGRSNGGVMNIITKSGTNDLRGSWFTLLRDDVMNAKTENEKRSDSDKQDYRRYQFGGSVGGPILQNRSHFFAAYERTQQDTFQVVDTLGLFPADDGVYTTPYRENLLTGKATAQMTPSQYLSVRYGRNTNSQPYGADPQIPPSGWGKSENKFNSINVNHNWVLAGSKLNEFIFQYADFANSISANSLDPQISFPNGVSIGQNTNTPQQTQQKKYQFRNDFSWNMSGLGGLGHDFKAGVNFIRQPRLFITFNTGTGDFAYSLGTNDINGIVTSVSRNGGAAEANIPNWQLGLYIQDDMRLNDRLTLNLGFRYDYVDGWAIDQTLNPNFGILQNAALAGRFAGQRAFRDFGLDTKEDTNNWQGRAGLAWDLRGDGRDLIRAGYGRYYDVGYTNANILFAAINATGIGAGQVFNVSNPNGIVRSDGQLFRVGDPVSTIESQNEAGGALPLNSHIASPRILQPYSDQYSIGWSHELDAATVVDIDYIHTDGRDLGWRIQLNQRNPGAGANGPRQFADLPISPANFNIDISDGKSRFNGVNFGIRRRMSAGLSFSTWYSLSSATSTTGNGSDELNGQNIQNHLDPYADVQIGPSGRTDARHRISLSAVWQAPYGFTVSPVFRYRSALPVNLTQGVDVNLNGVNNDISDTAYAFDGFDDNGFVKVKEIGPCETINCGRGASQHTFSLRVSKGFPIYKRMRIEAIGEVFNLFNAKNPSGFLGRRFIGSVDNPQPNLSDGVPQFLRPTEFAGDFQNPEQRVGQIGFRFTF